MDEVQTPPGAQLEAARRSKGLTQTDLAAKLGGVSQSLVSQWESGRRTPGLSDALALQGLLGLDACVWGYDAAQVRRVRAAFALMEGDVADLPPEAA